MTKKTKCSYYGNGLRQGAVDCYIIDPTPEQYTELERKLLDPEFLSTPECVVVVTGDKPTLDYNLTMYDFVYTLDITLWTPEHHFDFDIPVGGYPGYIDYDETDGFLISVEFRRVLTKALIELRYLKEV